VKSERISNVIFLRWLVKANYFLRNGLLFTDNDIKNILQKKGQQRNAHRSDLKFVAYQETSDYLAFVNNNNKIYLTKAGTLGNLFFVE